MLAARLCDEDIKQQHTTKTYQMGTVTAAVTKAMKLSKLD